MGETRAKKLSNRALKANRSKDSASRATGEPPITLTKPSDNDIHGTSSTSDASTYLMPPSLSSRTSHSSLVSSSSTSSWSRKHEVESYDPSRIEVQPTPNKGYALFAASRIPKGAIVLAEIPIIRLTAKDESRKLAAEEVLRKKFDNLPKTFQKDFKKLHDAKKDGFSQLRSIYHSNCYNLDGSRSTYGGSCIGITASRINHSCIPNVQFFFEEVVPENLFENTRDTNSDTLTDNKYDPTVGVIVFRALRSIPRGKEIVSNYETIYATRTQRQLQLQMHYGFRCDCDACNATTGFWASSDDRRREMIKYRQQVDAVENSFVIEKEAMPSGLVVDVYYQKEKRITGEASEMTDGLVPLSVNCCEETARMLHELEKLLFKEGLLGIELQRVKQEQAVWTKRAGMCVSSKDGL